MKAILCSIVATIVAVPALAAENVSVNESRFHLFSSKCESESEAGAETTPQSPPLNVDDPATPGCNRWEINVVADGDFTHAQRNLELPLLDVNYGIGDNIQLKYELPYMASQSQDGSSASAMGESKLGVKFQFFDDEKSKIQLAVYPQLTLVKSNADAVNKGLVTPGSITTLPLLMSIKLGETARGDINFTGNLGYNISSKEGLADFVTASVGIGAPVFNWLSVMSELATEQAVKALSEEPREQLIKANLGLVGTINHQFLLFGAVGHSLSASDTLDHAYGLVGFRFLMSGSRAGTEHVALNAEPMKGTNL